MVIFNIEFNFLKLQETDFSEKNLLHEKDLRDTALVTNTTAKAPQYEVQNPMQCLSEQSALKIIP